MHISQFNVRLGSFLQVLAKIPSKREEKTKTEGERRRARRIEKILRLYECTYKKIGVAADL